MDLFEARNGKRKLVDVQFEGLRLLVHQRLRRSLEDGT